MLGQLSLPGRGGVEKSLRQNALKNGNGKTQEEPKEQGWRGSRWRPAAIFGDMLRPAFFETIAYLSWRALG